MLLDISSLHIFLYFLNILFLSIWKKELNSRNQDQESDVFHIAFKVPGLDCGVFTYFWEKSHPLIVWYLTIDPQFWWKILTMPDSADAVIIYG